jgi:hypothetical protein
VIVVVIVLVVRIGVVTVLEIGSVEMVLQRVLVRAQPPAILGRADA